MRSVNGGTMTSQPLERNPNWQGGRTIDPRGYVLVKRPDHPNADVRGYVYEHRLVVEASIGRYLSKEEQVHHINENPSDNRAENLVHCLSLAEHKMRHRGVQCDRRLPSEGNPMIVCACGCGGALFRYDDYRRPRRYLTGHNMRGRRRASEDNPGIFCACGCGQLFAERDQYGRKRRFITGHNLHPGERPSTKP